MKTHTYIPSYRELNTDIAKVQAEFCRDGKSIQLNVRLLAAGFYTNRSSEIFNHPEPIFNRIFVFKKNTANIKTQYEDITLTPGNIYLLPAGLPFNVRYNACDFIFWHLQVEDYLGISIFENTKSILSLSEKPLYRKICKTNDSGNMFNLLPQIFELVSTFSQPVVDSLIAKYNDTEKFNPVFSHIQNTPPAKIQIDTLAEIMQMSRSALSKSFARKTGISIKVYLQNYQLQKAREMLMFSDLSVQEIAARLGHSSSQYFHRMFKKHTGMTPTDYRLKAIQEML